MTGYIFCGKELDMHHAIEIEQMKYCAECGADRYDASFGCWSCGGYIDNKDLGLYKQALTKAVSLPMGVLPDSKQYYSVMLNGNVVVKEQKI
jgi:hypothetical protein